MCVETGISKGNLSDLKMGRIKNLSAGALSKLANYFGVTVDFLLGAENEPAPADEAETDDEMASILETLRRRPDMRVLFSLSKNATPEDVKKFVNVSKAMQGDNDGASDC